VCVLPAVCCVMKAGKKELAVRTIYIFSSVRFKATFLILAYVQNSIGVDSRRQERACS
jgi:hypothetical protein